ncbi:hypothetical protein F4781DRAFT_309123 [Annulohypoxylon bovei var. microspora]|nr:hypothetical protein F4781DRAFT_309123 [Annulohypoxylon bovei var. microspora]
MRIPIYRRRARTNDFKIFVRDDALINPDDPSISDSDSDSDGDGLDSPSPTSPEFPPPPPPPPPPAQVENPAQDPAVASSEQIPPVATNTVSSTEQSSSTTTKPVTSSEQISSTATNSVSLQPTTLSSSTTVLAAQTSAIEASATQSTASQSTDVVEAQASQEGGATPTMSSGGAIAFGTVGAVVIVVAIIIFIWRCRRRQNKEDGSLFKPSGFTRMKEDRRPVTADYGSSRGGSSRDTPSRIMDNLMTAAYAAEDGNASQYGVSTNEKQQPNTYTFGPDSRLPMPMRQSSTSAPQPPDGGRGSNSLYVNQLLSGFYKGQATDGLAAPPNARVPPPAAPSIAGRTEVTTNTESTWRTWGWSQHKQPKDTWIDKCVRLGGLR